MLPGDAIELNCAVASLGVRGFGTSSRTVSSEIQTSNRSSLASLGVRGLATSLQQDVHGGVNLAIQNVE